METTPGGMGYRSRDGMLTSEVRISVSAKSRKCQQDFESCWPLSRSGSVGAAGSVYLSRAIRKMRRM